MPLALELTPELETRLRNEATLRGERPDALAVRLLHDHLPLVDRRESAIEMLTRWAEESEAMSEQEAEENAAILRSLDMNRPSERKLFDVMTEVKTP